MRRHFLLCVVVATAVIVIQGCAGVGLALFGVGTGVTGATGVSYTLDSVAYKTFAVSEAELRAATTKTLTRLAMPVTENEPTESGRLITATAGDRTVDTELDRITARTSRMRVSVKQGWFFKDRATAGEIIARTGQTIDNDLALSRRAR